MILFTLLLITLIVLAVATIIAAIVGGSGIILIFGDVIVCIALIAVIVKLFREKK